MKDFFQKEGKVLIKNPAVREALEAAVYGRYCPGMTEDEKCRAQRELGAMEEGFVLGAMGVIRELMEDDAVNGHVPLLLAVSSILEDTFAMV